MNIIPPSKTLKCPKVLTFVKLSAVGLSTLLALWFLALLAAQGADFKLLTQWVPGKTDEIAFGFWLLMIGGLSGLVSLGLLIYAHKAEQWGAQGSQREKTTGQSAKGAFTTVAILAVCGLAAGFLRINQMHKEENALARLLENKARWNWALLDPNDQSPSGMVFLKIQPLDPTGKADTIVSFLFPRSAADRLQYEIENKPGSEVSLGNPAAESIN
jgi:hypothetical protein